MIRLIAILAVMAMPLAASAQTSFSAGINGQQTVALGCLPGGSPSGGTGTGTFTLNEGTGVLSYNISFSGLAGAETIAHVHGSAAPGDPAGVVFGLPAGSPKIGSSPALTAPQIADLQAGLFYVNIHSTSCAGGEIRGQILQTGATTVRYSMTGAWYLSRSPLVKIPQNGGVVICGAGSAMDGCVGGLAAKNGGVPGIRPVDVNPTSLGTITVPTAAFFQDYMTAASVHPVTFVPTVIQLATSFKARGPTAPGVFKKFGWVDDPQQAGRLGADFSWCPGGPNPNCAAVPLVGLPHRVVYTSNAAQFGGTMALVFSGTGSLAVKADALPSGLVQVGPLGATINAAGNQAPGRGYATTDTDNLQPGNVFLSYMLNFPCTGPIAGGPIPSGCGVIATLGPLIAPGATDTNTNFAMPFTTGMVTAINHGTILKAPQSTTLIASGSQNRNAIGAGNITLVAGATSHRNNSGQDFSNLDVVSMQLAPNVPSLSVPGLVGGVVLLALSAGYALRRRF